MDHAGATLYSEQQVQRTMRDLTENVYGNPHSRSECSQRTTELIEEVRSRLVLEVSCMPGTVNDIACYLLPHMQ